MSTSTLLQHCNVPLLQIPRCPAHHNFDGSHLKRIHERSRIYLQAEQVCASIPASLTEQHRSQSTKESDDIEQCTELQGCPEALDPVRCATQSQTAPASHTAQTYRKPAAVQYTARWARKDILPDMAEQSGWAWQETSNPDHHHDRSRLPESL